ncbi:MAG: alpha/beta fold hydrolase [Promethearchaeota archaeon]
MVSDSFEINKYLQDLRTNPIAENGTAEYYVCSSGDKLYYRVWAADKSIENKIIIAIHGMGAHSEYYIQVADQLIEEGITIYALDVKHHGHSTGRKGDLKDFKEILNHIYEFTIKIRGLNPNLPIFMMGLSMGGMLTVNYSVKYPDELSGIILMAPAVSSNFKLKVSDIAKLPLLIFAFLIIKGKPIVNTEKRGGLTTRNPLREKYQNHDDYRIKKVSVRFLFNMAKWVKKAFNNAKNISHPIIIFQGTADQLVSPEGVKEFFNNILIKDKEFVCLKDAYHSLYSDFAMEKQGGWEKLRNWINNH